MTIHMILNLMEAMICTQKNNLNYILFFVFSI
jgi:hypothetical protein